MPRFAEDTDAAVAWLRARPGMAQAPVVLLGHSVGAAAVLLAASRRDDIAAVVSLSAFAHPDGMMRRWLKEKGLPFFPLGWYVLRYVERVIGHRFAAIAPVTTLPRVGCPVLLVHGLDDSVIPPEDAERLHASRGATPTRLHLLPGDHDLSRHIEAELPALLAFLEAALAEARHSRRKRSEPQGVAHHLALGAGQPLSASASCGPRLRPWPARGWMTWAASIRPSSSSSRLRWPPRHPGHRARPAEPGDRRQLGQPLPQGAANDPVLDEVAEVVHTCLATSGRWRRTRDGPVVIKVSYSGATLRPLTRNRHRNVTKGPFTNTADH
ncbi:alpha/beta hydrolase [Halomonas sp. A11-A]|uniref:prolyl oligopeptidase family serine peptidase n=1 Tax=Halomonas sp. A11-A TaxID=2183985 RepID=UPI000D91FAD2|nr:alpha/beta hydrolase [Halomonas sp. A11-A]PWV75320.1 prolyl oligopeptidase family protein [Halomonas sp. A11-A]